MEKLFQFCSGVWSVAPFVFGFSPALILNAKNDSCSTTGCSLEAEGLQSNVNGRLKERLLKYNLSPNPDVQNPNPVDITDLHSVPTPHIQDTEGSIGSRVNIDRQQEKSLTSQNKIELPNQVELSSVPLDLSLGRCGSSDPMTGTQNNQANSVVPKRLQKVTLGQSKKIHQCEVCGRFYRRGDTLKEHLKIHTGVKLFECKICDKRFCQKGDLKRHQRVHDGAQPFHCMFCGKRFSLMSNLNTHKRIHTGEKIQCTICKKGFVQAGHLKRHLLTHTGEKLFECTKCGNRFTSNQSLQLHTKNVCPPE